ncbi:MAG: hypothetical protein KDB27_01595 [Planctomycetales bacterium]|nr:hypothetical protein [Planctomycetales bacterium]
MADDPIRSEHIRRNDETLSRRGVMSSHRDHVMSHILNAGRNGGQRLCILGAGNCNDVDLETLARAFDQITLVDIDSIAIDRAVESLSPKERTSVTVIGNVDVAGIYDRLDGIGEPSSNISLVDLIELANSFTISLGEPFDVVCSTCLLTQLIDSVCMKIPESHPQFVELVLTVRNRHLRLIAELLAPNGFGLLITDFVSSRTAPELAVMTAEQLPVAAMKWIANRNFFTGVNPFLLRQRFQQSAELLRLAEFKYLSKPWKWDIGEKKFAVCVLTIRAHA